MRVGACLSEPARMLMMMAVRQLQVALVLATQRPTTTTQRIGVPIRCCAVSRQERRADWWADNFRPESEPLLLTDPKLVVRPGSVMGEHPLYPLLKDAATDLGAADPEAAALDLRVGQRVMCQVVGSSGLGLSVALLPSGASGLVYADETGYPPDDGIATPAALGDVVPAYVCKIRDDAKLDLSWRRQGTVPKLEQAAQTLLRALLAASDEGGVLPLGDASSPESIRRVLGLSKASFKAARGRLLKAGLLGHPLLPIETRLAEGVTSWPDDWQSDAAGGDGAVSSADTAIELELSPLPAAAAHRVSGAAALLRLLSDHGEVRSLRGLVDGGAPSGRVRAVFRSETDARAALAQLRLYYGSAAGEDEPAPRARLLGAEDEGEFGQTGVHQEREGEEEEAWDEEPDAEWATWPRDPRKSAAGRSAPGRYAGEGAAASTPPSQSRRPCSVFVGNLPRDATEGDLWDLFLDCGYIKTVSIPTDENGAARGFGRVSFVEDASVAAALRLGGSRLRGRVLRIEQSKERPEQRRESTAGRRNDHSRYDSRRDDHSRYERRDDRPRHDRRDDRSRYDPNAGASSDRQRQTLGRIRDGHTRDGPRRGNSMSDGRQGRYERSGSRWLGSSGR